MANSFNLRGKLRRLFGVLNDDMIGSGPRARPGSLLGVASDKGQASETSQPNNKVPDQIMASVDIGDQATGQGAAGVRPHITGSGYYTSSFGTPSKRKEPDDESSGQAEGGGRPRSRRLN